MANADLSSLPDVALLGRYVGGDRTAARILTARLLPVAYRVAARILGDRTEAEDVAQETMLRLWRAAPGWVATEARVSTWLYRVTVNLCTDRLRRRQIVPIDDIQEPVAPDPSAVDRMIAANRVAAIEQALARLPERQRQAVVLRHLEGLSNPEIAEVMDIGVEAVESLTARAKRGLAAYLVPQREDLGYDS